MAAVDFWRQSGIVTQDQINRYSYTLVGAGGIGSPTALVLTKMGVSRLTVFDFDTVEAHNVPNQLYGTADIGKTKVDALGEHCTLLTDATITPKPERVDASTQLSGIVICTVDTMSARKEIWDATIKYNPGVDLYIEARMGAEEGRLYAFNPSDPDYVDKYEKTLYTDDDALELPCTERAISYNVFFIAGLIGCQVKKFVTDSGTDFQTMFSLESLMLLATR